MSTRQWGRKETVIFPPHSPIYTYGAVFLSAVLTGLFVFLHFHFAQTVLQQFYTPMYFRTAAGAVFHKKENYQLLYVNEGGKAARLAIPTDVQAGETAVPDGKPFPLALIPEASTRLLSRAAPQMYFDDKLHAYLRAAIFDNEELQESYRRPLLLGVLSLFAQLPFAIRKDIRRRKEMKYGRRLKGPVLLTPKQFNKAVEGSGIGFKTTEMKEPMRIPERSEAQHIELMGDTGAGKTTLIMQVLRQVQARGHSAIVYDPASEYIQRFYDEKRGDIVLNPLDDRCPYWGPAEELRRKAEAKTIAASLYQPTSDKKGEFFTETPQKIFAHLLTEGPSPAELIHWLSNPDEIDIRVEGTEMATMIAKGAQDQRNGVLASLGLIADSLRMLPTRDEAKGRTWSATDWAETRKGWIFITSRPTEREALRPLHSLWIDLLVMRLLSAPTEGQKPVWFVLDELASLQRLPQLHTAITENRKSKNPLVLGFQGKAQLEVIYGHMAEVMLSQPATKIFLKTTEPNAAEWVSKAIGKVEIERMKETHSDGTRAGKSFTLDRQIEPLVMESEISGLEDRHAFLKLGNHVARFDFDYLDLPKNTPAFLPRKLTNDELSFDPKTLKKLRVTAPSVNLENPAPARLDPHTAVATAAIKASASRQETVRESDPRAPEVSERPAPLPASQGTNTAEDQLGSGEASETEAMYEFKVG